MLYWAIVAGLFAAASGQPSKCGGIGGGIDPDCGSQTRRNPPLFGFSSIGAGPTSVSLGPELAGSCVRSTDALSAAVRRGVAQSGSASGLGPEGRRFESCLPDHRRPATFGPPPTLPCGRPRHARRHQALIRTYLRTAGSADGSWRPHTLPREKKFLRRAMR